jgi:hypothetical protein
MTAGHNALGGSGPGHKRAFNDALAQVGCPDRQIDRLCITSCPEQTAQRTIASFADIAKLRCDIRRARQPVACTLMDTGALKTP